MRQAWTTSEQRWLAGLAPTHTVAELAEKLERSKGAIVSQLNLIGITAKPQKKAWTQREVKLVQEMMHDFTYEEIARELGRSSASVRAYVRRCCNPERRKHTWEPTRREIARIARLRKNKVSLPVIAEKLGCTRRNLENVIKQNNIRRGIGYVR